MSATSKKWFKSLPSSITRNHLMTTFLANWARTKCSQPTLWLAKWKLKWATYIFLGIKLKISSSKKPQTLGWLSHSWLTLNLSIRSFTLKLSAALVILKSKPKLTLSAGTLRSRLYSCWPSHLSKRKRSKTSSRTLTLRRLVRARTNSRCLLTSKTWTRWTRSPNSWMRRANFKMCLTLSTSSSLFNTLTTSIS